LGVCKAVVLADEDFVAENRGSVGGGWRVPIDQNVAESAQRGWGQWGVRIGSSEDLELSTVSAVANGISGLYFEAVRYTALRGDTETFADNTTLCHNPSLGAFVVADTVVKNRGTVA